MQDYFFIQYINQHIELVVSYYSDAEQWQAKQLV